MGSTAPKATIYEQCRLLRVAEGVDHVPKFPRPAISSFFESEHDTILKSGMVSRWRVNEGLAGHWIKQWLGVAANRIKGAMQASTRWLLHTLQLVLVPCNSLEDGPFDHLPSHRECI